MTLDERLEKRIEIAARLASDLITKWGGFPRGFMGDCAEIGTAALNIADAIIDTAIGDMTAEPK